MIAAILVLVAVCVLLAVLLCVGSSDTERMRQALRDVREAVCDDLQDGDDILRIVNLALDPPLPTDALTDTF